MNSPRGTSLENPHESAQVVVTDESGRIFFHKNKGLKAGSVKNTFFGGKLEKEDDNAFICAIREIKEESGVILRSKNLVKITEDGPSEFEKGWFLAHIYFALVSVGTGKAFAKHDDTLVFSSYDGFLIRGVSLEWGTSFEHVKGLVDKALASGK